MRWMWGVALIAALTACSKEPDFDERYDKANAEIDARVKMLDAAVEKDFQAELTAGEPAIKLHLPVEELEPMKPTSSGE